MSVSKREKFPRGAGQMLETKGEVTYFWGSCLFSLPVPPMVQIRWRRDGCPGFSLHNSEHNPLGAVICGTLKKSLYPYLFPEPSEHRLWGETAGAGIPEQPLLAV